MAGYSGSTSFDFEIERFKDRDSDNLVTPDGAKPVLDDLEYDYQLITLKVKGNSYFTPGRTYGPPEDSYPDEGDTEIESVVGPDGKDWQDKLTKEEEDQIMQMIAERVASNDPEDEEDDYDDFDYEADYQDEG